MTIIEADDTLWDIFIILMKENITIEFFTPQQIANKLQLNVLTIYSYIKNKKLAGIKIGRNYRISYKDFDTFVRINKMSS